MNPNVTRIAGCLCPSATSAIEYLAKRPQARNLPIWIASSGVASATTFVYFGNTPTGDGLDTRSTLAELRSIAKHEAQKQEAYRRSRAEENRMRAMWL